MPGHKRIGASDKSNLLGSANSVFVARLCGSFGNLDGLNAMLPFVQLSRPKKRMFAEGQDKQFRTGFNLESYEVYLTSSSITCVCRIFLLQSSSV